MLVREYREGRQKEHETTHIIEEGADKTVCGKYKSSESRSVRNIGTVTESGIFCPECSEKIDNLA